MIQCYYTQVIVQSAENLFLWTTAIGSWVIILQKWIISIIYFQHITQWTYLSKKCKRLGFTISHLFGQVRGCTFRLMSMMMMMVVVVWYEESLGSCLRACVDGGEDWIMCFVRISHPLHSFLFLGVPKHPKIKRIDHWHLPLPLISDLDYSNLASYRNQYDQAKIAWEATNNGGPDASKCQYYQGSSVPIFVITGEGSYSGGKSLRVMRSSSGK